MVIAIASADESGAIFRFLSDHKYFVNCLYLSIWFDLFMRINIHLEFI